jgi:uncharacterized protein
MGPVGTINPIRPGLALTNSLINEDTAFQVSSDSAEGAGEGVRRRRLIVAAVSAVAALSSMGYVSLVTFNSATPELTVLDIGLGRRVAFVADLHIHSRGERHVENALRILEDSGAEFFILGGDMVDEETIEISALDWFLRELNIGRGYAVLGNHEYWSRKVEDTLGALRAHSVEALRDEAVSTPFGKLLGLDWRESRQYGYRRFDGFVAVHDPNAAERVEGRAFVAAGHTHGGLVLFGQTIYTNSKYVRGLYKLGGGALLYVTRGVGQMFHQPRINSPPEILLLE